MRAWACWLVLGWLGCSSNGAVDGGLGPGLDPTAPPLPRPRAIGDRECTVDLAKCGILADDTDPTETTDGIDAALAAMTREGCPRNCAVDVSRKHDVRISGGSVGDRDVHTFVTPGEEGRCICVEDERERGAIDHDNVLKKDGRSYSYMLHECRGTASGQRAERDALRHRDDAGRAPFSNWDGQQRGRRYVASDGFPRRSF